MQAVTIILRIHTDLVHKSKALPKMSRASRNKKKKTLASRHRAKEAIVYIPLFSPRACPCSTSARFAWTSPLFDSPDHTVYACRILNQSSNVRGNFEISASFVFDRGKSEKLEDFDFVSFPTNSRENRVFASPEVVRRINKD